METIIVTYIHTDGARIIAIFRLISNITFNDPGEVSSASIFV